MDKPNEKMVSDITYVWTEEGWLYGKQFKRQEARAAVLEYIEIFYNRQRIHTSNNYLTPEEYYNSAIKEVKVVWRLK